MRVKQLKALIAAVLIASVVAELFLAVDPFIRGCLSGFTFCFVLAAFTGPFQYPRQMNRPD
jgi:hypothetical protein